MTLFRDGKGRLWIATRGSGACRVDDPGAQDPACVPITTREGLSSDEVSGVAEDAQGRIYVGTSRGVDVLEGDRVIRHLGKPEGLPHQYVNVMYDDPDGTIWFGTLNGLARLQPGASLRVPVPPRVLIDGLRIAGVPHPLSALGEKTIEDLVLAPDERRLQIDFIGLSQAPGGRLRFQHRLEETEAWSDPTAETTLLLPNLTPGRYRFEVQALDAAGVTSSEPAVVSFRVLAPVWRRPWFLALAAALLLAAAIGTYRVRVAHLLALERQRMRIAMDLHDEVGSGLGSIGVLADLAAEEGLERTQKRVLLDQVASTASELSTSMGDIVWSLRTGSDTIESLGRHLAERGRRLFPGGGSVLQMRFPSSWPEVRLSLPVRHNVAMIGIEALHNAARHSGATAVTLDLSPEERRWRLSVSDNGRGLPEADSAGEGGGLGFTSMRRRAEEIGAELRLESQREAGTTVTVLFDPAVEAKGRIR